MKTYPVDCAHYLRFSFKLFWNAGETKYCSFCWNSVEKSEDPSVPDKAKKKETDPVTRFDEVLWNLYEALAGLSNPVTKSSFWGWKNRKLYFYCKMKNKGKVIIIPDK